MQISPEVLKNIRKIVFLEYEPNDKTVMWAKPDGSGQFMFLVYNNGAWQQVSEDEGVIINISDISGNLSTFNNDAGFITEADIGDVIEGASAGSTALQPSDIADWAKQTSKPSYTASEVGALPDTTKYAGSQSVGDAANKAVSIPFGQVDSTSTNTAFTATVEGITELRDGVCCYIRNNVINGSANFTLDINGLGAKPVYNSTSDATRTGAQFSSISTMPFIYNSTKVEGGCWDMYFGVDTNTNSIGYQIRGEGYTYVPKTVLYVSHLVFESSETEVLPVNTVNNSAAANKELTTESFNPFGIIAYYTGSTVTTGQFVSSESLWFQRAIDLKYSFNEGSTLVLNKNVYVVCVPQSDGRVKLASSPISQELPTTEDGKVYIFLGVAYSQSAINLWQKHPIYYFKDGAIRQWTNSRENILEKSISDKESFLLSLSGASANAYVCKMVDGSIYMQTTKPTVTDIKELYGVPLRQSSIDFAQTFAGATEMTKVFADAWDMKNVKSMYGMFRECPSLEEIRLPSAANMNTAQPANMVSLFDNCSSLKKAILGDYPNAVSIRYLFYRTIVTDVVVGDLGGLDPSIALNGEPGAGAWPNTLVNLEITKLGKGNHYFEGCSNLTHASAMQVINALVELDEGESYNVNFHRNVYDGLSADDIGIATAKGWTVTRV